MLDKKPSGATTPDVAPKTEGKSPGGAFPQTPSPVEPIVDTPVPYRQFTLQYLIAAITKPSRKE